MSPANVYVYMIIYLSMCSANVYRLILIGI